MGKEVMDCRYRNYFLFTSSAKAFINPPEKLFSNLFDCKFSSPYNHFEHGKYDGSSIGKYITHMVSVPICSTDSFLNFIIKHDNNIGTVIAKFNSENNNWDIL